MVFLTALFNALGAIPAFVKLMDSLVEAWSSYKKSKAQGDIADATKASATATTTDDVKKAAEAAAKATRDL